MALLGRRSAPRPCIRCKERLASTGLRVCMACLLRQAGRANRAYDLVRQSRPDIDPRLMRDRMVEEVLATLDANHDTHVEPSARCSFCALRKA